MSECSACAIRGRLHSIQMEGREAAVSGQKRSDNPYKGLEASYWEYGWIETNFVAEIEEHRAVMDWVGKQLFMLAERIDKLKAEEHITARAQDEMKNIIDVICRKLAEKLNGD